MPTKTRKQRSKKNPVPYLLGFLNSVKMYHWRTRHYADHKATDELYKSLTSSIDEFVEVMMGEENHRVPALHSIPVADSADTPSFRRVVGKFKTYLALMSLPPDLMNIRDSMMADLNQFLFLTTLR